MWRGGCRPNISVSAPFVWRCLSGSTLTPFPHPANRQDPLAISVAKLIIEFAKDGERDPIRLRDLVLKTVRPNKP
jgi:hypothetical protein